MASDGMEDLKKKTPVPSIALCFGISRSFLANQNQKLASGCRDRFVVFIESRLLFVWEVSDPRESQETRRSQTRGRLVLRKSRKGCIKDECEGASIGF